MLWNRKLASTTSISHEATFRAVDSTFEGTPANGTTSCHARAPMLTELKIMAKIPIFFAPRMSLVADMSIFDFLVKVMPTCE